MRVTSHILSASGVGPQPGEFAGICRTCGEYGTGALFADWVKPTFTDHDKLQAGYIVCPACLFCFDERSEPCAKLVGKPEPQRMRNYSHFVRHGEWIPLSKGAKPRMRELIYDSEVVVIALSGQKHLCFRCPPGWWQIEEHTVRPFPAELRKLAEPVSRLYQVFSKTEIETGRYQHRRILEYGVEKWAADNGLIHYSRRTLAFELALFLAQKDEEENE